MNVKYLIECRNCQKTFLYHIVFNIVLYQILWNTCDLMYQKKCHLVLWYMDSPNSKGVSMTKSASPGLTGWPEAFFLWCLQRSSSQFPKEVDESKNMSKNCSVNRLQLLNPFMIWSALFATINNHWDRCWEALYLEFLHQRANQARYMHYPARKYVCIYIYTYMNNWIYSYIYIYVYIYI